MAVEIPASVHVDGPFAAEVKYNAASQKSRRRHHRSCRGMDVYKEGYEVVADRGNTSTPIAYQETLPTPTT